MSNNFFVGQNVRPTFFCIENTLFTKRDSDPPVRGLDHNGQAKPGHYGLRP